LVYPSRAIHDVLPQFVGTNVMKPTAEQRAQLLAFVAAEYPRGRSLRELAELTGRTQTAIRKRSMKWVCAAWAGRAAIAAAETRWLGKGCRRRPPRPACTARSGLVHLVRGAATYALNWLL